MTKPNKKQLMQDFANEFVSTSTNRTSVEDQVFATNSTPTEGSIQAHPSKPPKKFKTVPWYYSSEKLKKEVKMLSVDENTSMTKLIEEGLRYVFEKRGKNFEDYI